MDLSPLLGDLKARSLDDLVGLARRYDLVKDIERTAQGITFTVFGKRHELREEEARVFLQGAAVTYVRSRAVQVRQAPDHSLALTTATGTLRLREAYRGDVLVVTLLDSRLDVRTAYALKRQLHGHIEAGQRRMVLDLTPLTFLDSGGLGAIISVRKALDTTGRLVLVRPGLEAMRVFRLTQMDQIFTWANHVDEALVRVR